MIGTDQINIPIGVYFILAALLGIFGFLAYVIISREWFDKRREKQQEIEK